MGSALIELPSLTRGQLEVHRYDRRPKVGSRSASRTAGPDGAFWAIRISVFNFVITSENIPKTLSAMLGAYQLSPFVFLAVVNVILLILGCFLEGTTIILVILPVLIPTAQALGD